VLWIFFGPILIAVAVGIGWAIGATCGQKIFRRTRGMIEDTLYETNQSYPRLATQLADISMQFEMDLAQHLETKKHPAIKSAEEIRRISKEKRELAIRCKMCQYQLEFYENLFPWLESFKEVPVQEAIEFAEQNLDKDYDEVRRWLSPSEYKKLPNTAKFQLALNRWMERKKTAWDVGIEYERYIGYLLEVHGYRVKYFGAIMGLEDMGRDLLATKDEVTLVIQCKRWMKEKTIHEKHICQLYGSVAVLASQNPNKNYKGVFITTAQLSDVARSFARYSNISVVENCTFASHPLIKCNISKSGERIYHLPFDQQYDRVNISGKKDTFYAWTVKEAEAKGFRRAYRWHPDN
jgi:hypothetical protein